jgi:hypothetical protein
VLGELFDALEFIQEVFGQETSLERRDVWLQRLGEIQQFFGFALQCDRIDPGRR